MFRLQWQWRCKRLLFWGTGSLLHITPLNHLFSLSSLTTLYLLVYFHSFLHIRSGKKSHFLIYIMLLYYIQIQILRVKCNKNANVYLIWFLGLIFFFLCALVRLYVCFALSLSWNNILGIILSFSSYSFLISFFLSVNSYLPSI